MEAAKDALDDMPPRDESELDAVTLHNQALVEMDDKPTEGFRKLNFLLHQHPSPPETFANLLLLYCKYSYFDLAAKHIDALRRCTKNIQDARRQRDQNMVKK